MKLVSVALALAAAAVLPATALTTAGGAAAAQPPVVQQTSTDPADQAAGHSPLCPAGQHTTDGARTGEPERDHDARPFPGTDGAAWNASPGPYPGSRPDGAGCAPGDDARLVPRGGMGAWTKSLRRTPADRMAQPSWADRFSARMPTARPSARPAEQRRRPACRCASFVRMA
ncbi:hypothetical protein ACFP1Z_22250 [Streptomyces gamaensis]|uniref:Secreted protein n=1 Tax=Streptomyces gamaensis TaxID=1763542 RepID=A0ABW0Z368_9ACTN